MSWKNEKKFSLGEKKKQRGSTVDALVMNDKVDGRKRGLLPFFISVKGALREEQKHPTAP